MKVEVARNVPWRDGEGGREGDLDAVAGGSEGYR